MNKQALVHCPVTFDVEYYEFGYSTLLMSCVCYSTESDPAVITDERAQQIIDQALEKSSINQRNMVGGFTGLMGSGKTWLLSRLFNTPPPELYTSTGIAEQSFRTLFHHIGQIGALKLLSNENIRELLAPLFLAGITEADMASLTANLMCSMDNPAAGTSDPLPLPAPPSADTSPDTAPQSDYPPPPPKVADSLPKESPTSQAIVNLVKTTTGSVSELLLELIHMIDTGGQLELMEVMPSVIHNANLAVLVVNLLHILDQHPRINLHVKGVNYKRELFSQYTGRQIILKLASTLQANKSCRGSASFFRLLVVATHRDCVEGDLGA